jgi:general stress protein YciG
MSCNSLHINYFRPHRGTGVAVAGVARGVFDRAGNSGTESNSGTEEDQVAKEDRGFASMDRAKQREIASKGGKAAHQKGTAHEWTSEEARDAGRKGGIASHRRRREALGLGNPPETAQDETRNAVPAQPGRLDEGDFSGRGDE